MTAPYVDPDELVVVEGWSSAVTVKFRDATALSTVNTKIYRGNQDVSDDWLTGSDSASGDTLTSKTITVPTGAAGKNYAALFSVVVDSARTEKRALKIRVWRAPKG